MNLKYAFQKLGKLYFQYKSASQMLAYLERAVPFFMKAAINIPFDKRLLLVSAGWWGAAIEAVYTKALENLGYQVCVLTRWDPFVVRVFKLFGINKIYFYNNFTKNISLGELNIETRGFLQNNCVESVLKLKKYGAHIGKYAASSFMRQTRESNFDFRNKQKKALFINHLTRSLKFAIASQRIMEDIKPDLIFVNDRGYTPVGQLFDGCLDRGIPIIQRCGSHKGGSEILKRYTDMSMNKVHHQSLSKESWEYVRSIPWSEEVWQEIYNELKHNYVTGEWFSEVGTQFNKKIYSKEELVTKLKLNPNKKTVGLFPHMFWDATFFWGEDLFRDYYDWFVNVLKAAEQNRNLNWIIKIHPANIVKAKRDNYRGEHKELTAIHQTLGEIPQHIKIIPPESDINTFSLFSLMDYCLTVRGTIGIESSAFGIRTITAGTGRYDRLGFTYDFDSKDEYINCIKSLEKVPPMTEEQINLARRYAYGIFLLRPIHIDLLDYGYEHDDKGTIRFKPLFKTKEEFEQSSFVKKFREFVLSGKEDFLDMDLVKTFSSIN